MVEGINTIGAGLSVASVIQQTAPPPKREGGAATGDAKASPKEDQSQTIKSLLGDSNNNDNDFISRAETILNKALSAKSPNTKLRIDVDDGSGLFVYSSVDKQSGEVISQFPAKEILALIAFYRETEGIVVDETV